MENLNTNAFGSILHPLTKEIFFNEYYERRHLFIERGDPGYYADLLCLQDLSKLIYNQTLKHPDVKVVDATKETVKVEEYATSAGRIKPDRIMKLFSEGSTIIFSGLHDYVASLGKYIDFLSKELGHRFQTNIYLTPANAQGFKVHYDTHDVFILQTEGSKVWKLYGTPVELPLKTQEFKPGTVEAGELVAEVTLRKGDMLYVPRGLMHEACATDEISMHITTGFLGYTWADLLVNSILGLSKTNVEMRKNLPVDLLTQQADEKAIEHFERLINIIKNGVDLKKSAAAFHAEVLNSQKPNIPYLFETALQLQNIDIYSEVFVRDNIMFDIEKKDGNIVIDLLGNEVSFPDYTEPVFNFIKESADKHFLITELPDCLDDEGKLVLVKRMIKEGLMGISDSNNENTVAPLLAELNLKTTL